MADKVAKFRKAGSGPQEPFSTPGELDTYLPYLITRLSSLWNINQNRDLNALGISNVMVRTLSALFIFRTLSVNEIAALAVADQSVASRTIETMVTAGLIERRVSGTDLRRREIALTASGEALLRRAWPSLVSSYAQLVDGIDAKALATTAATLARMIENVQDNRI